MSRGIVALVVLFLASCSTLHGYEEARFTLSPSSRIPKWFSLPSGYSRGDVSVRVTYYTSTDQTDDALFELIDMKGRVLSAVSGQHCWLQLGDWRQNPGVGLYNFPYPHKVYQYIRIDGIVEVFGGGMVLDDASLHTAAEATKKCDKS